MNILNGPSDACTAARTPGVVLVSAPADQDDMSVLPGEIAPGPGTAYQALAPGVHWTIRGGETVWSQTPRATLDE